MSKIRLRFWGVRGAIAAPPSGSSRIGANTSCVEVVAGDSRIILDAGSGIYRLAVAKARELAGGNVTLLFSHVHLDHIMGLPFFLGRLGRKGRALLLGPRLGRASFRAAINYAFRHPTFPVTFTHIPVRLAYRTLAAGRFKLGRIVIDAFQLHHPGGSFGYRLTFPGGRSIVYATDSEPKSAAHTKAMAKWLAGADVVIHDAEFTPAEYQQKIGWGHSPYTFPLRLAGEAGVKRLFLFHHHPDRNDSGMQQLLVDARREMRRRGWTFRCELAREGATLVL